MRLEFLEERAVPANINWIGASGANWSATGSWQGGVVPGSGDIAVFDATQATPGIVNVDTAETVGGILFSNSSGTPFTISGSMLTLQVGTITVQGTTNETISAPQKGSLVFNVPSGVTLTDSGVISGSSIAGLKESYINGNGFDTTNPGTVFANPNNPTR